GGHREDDWNRLGRLQQGPQSRVAVGEDDVGRERNGFRYVPADVSGIRPSPARVDPDIAADAPARFLQTLHERADTNLVIRIVGRCGQEQGDTPHPLRLLPGCHDGPRRRAAEKADERAPFHSITSSAIESRLSETLTPSALAVLALMTSSNLVGCRIG